MPVPQRSRSHRPDYRIISLLAAALLGCYLVPGTIAEEHSAAIRPPAEAHSKDGLNTALKGIAPGIRKWATVCIIHPTAEGRHEFEWIDYADTGDQTDFWPASTVKLYAVVAALELLNENGFGLDTTVQFEHREGDQWVLDCARSMKEMISEVFRRSSNEDYTLLLRMVGIDRINTEFLIPSRGFPHSALLRGYVLQRPFRYVTTEPQRITLRDAAGTQTAVFDHTWSGRSYAQERGCTVIDAKTGNVTSPRELAECLRRILFHEESLPSQRYRLTAEQLEFLRGGGSGLVGLETKLSDSFPTAWANGVETVFLEARFFHKSGCISNYAMDLAYVDDSAQSQARFILVPVVNAGEDTEPVPGKTFIAEMARAISLWVKARDTTSK